MDYSQKLLYWMLVEFHYPTLSKVAHSKLYEKSPGREMEIFSQSSFC